MGSKSRSRNKEIDSQHGGNECAGQPVENSTCWMYECSGMQLLTELFISRHIIVIILHFWLLLRLKDKNTKLNHSPPSKLGYCLDSSSGYRHEYCRCIKGFESVSNCEQRCDIDSECRGYSYRYTHASCYLYTTSNCTHDCLKGNVGKVGKIVEITDNEESGCFIKDNVENIKTTENVEDPEDGIILILIEKLLKFEILFRL